MNLREALRHSNELLSCYKINDAHLEAELLLRHVLGLSRAQLYIDQNRELTAQQSQDYQSLVQRRIKGEPSAYIIGHREFYSLDFYVDRSVLIPRPESELLVDKALDFALEKLIMEHPIIVDVGTGCGNLAISIAKNLPQARIYASDISREALVVAAVNCQRHDLSQSIQLLHGHLLEPLPEKVNIIVANLPYVKESEFAKLEPHVRNFEPRLALHGGSQGLDYIAKLLAQAPDKLSPGGAIFLELGADQGKSAVTLAQKSFPRSEICLYPDLNGIDRVLGVIGKK